MSLTPEQLDEARAQEAITRFIRGESVKTYEGLAHLAARLAREGWTPTDPDLIEARGLVATVVAPSTTIADIYRAGEMDCSPHVRVALAAIKRGRELAAQS